MTVKQFCDKYNLTVDQFYGREKFDGYLDLGRLTSIPEGFNPTVGGYLDLGRLTSIPEGFNPTVGGNLYLGSLTSIPEGFNPTVGGNLYLGRLICGRPETKVPTYPFSFKDGKYLLADGILQEVVSKKGLVYRVKNIGKSDITYLVTDGHGKFAHGDTLKEARESLIYKIGDRGKSKFNGMNPDTALKYSDAIEAYRVITGACEAGTKHFVSSILGTPKKSYTIAEIVKLTTGQYGNREFANFFGIGR